MTWSHILLSKWHLLIGVILTVLVMVILVVPEAHAAQTIPYKMNFQGRLANSSGTAMPDGLYNMKFRIYDAASGGAQQWTETRETTTRVQVTNGLFSTQLGDVTGLPPSIFTTQNLYFEIEMPSVATATCSTASCASYTEGPMTPRNKLGSSAYAFNADQIDGIDGASLARNDAANTYSAANIFNDTITIGSTNSATKFVVKDNSDVALFTADTTTTIVKVGTTSAATLANVRLLTTSAEFTGTVRIGTATDGVDISGATGITLSGTARGSKVVTLSPEYGGATFIGDGSNNNGALSSDFCSPASLLAINAALCAPGVGGDRAHNYYQWTVSTGSLQDYDVYVRYQIPSDYSTGSMANFKIWGHAASGANGAVQASMYTDASATACFTSSDIATQNSLWESATIASPLGSCVIAANDYVTFKIHLEANATTARVGDLSYSYRSKF